MAGRLNVLKALILVLITANSAWIPAQYYGMSFSGMSVSLDQRSSLMLTPGRALHAGSDLSLQFHMQFAPFSGANYGYVFRLLIGDKNIDLVHGIVPGNPNNFELILDKKTSDIVFQVPVNESISGWVSMNLLIDSREEKIYLHVEDSVYEDEFTGYNLQEGVRLMFGAHSFGRYKATDVPEMTIRDVKLELDGSKTVHWPLDETEGTSVRSIPQGREGIAINPGWLLKQHNTWKKLHGFIFQGEVLSAIDPKNDRIFIVSEDSVIIFDLAGSDLTGFTHSSPDYIRIFHGLIYDTITERLILYSVDEDYLSAFDPKSGKWQTFYPGFETAFWQHNPMYAPDGKLYVLGGYGLYRYKNTVLLWDPGKLTFDTVSYSGEFSPRYLAGSGYNPTDSLVYIIGGYGSESGNQKESPDYKYDIIGYSFRNREFSEIAKFEELERDFCFARSITFDNEKNLFALSFDKYRFNNRLQLLRVSLEDATITELGNTIDFLFNDVSSFSDMYYSRQQNSLVTVLSSTFDDTSRVSIHSIAFPPQPFSGTAIAEPGKRPSLAIYFGAAGLIVLLLVFVYLQRKRKSTDLTTGPGQSVSEIKKSLNNSILLFGGFRVIDRTGNEITGKFTPLPKKLFLFILLHSLRDDKGVSTNRLNETFWFDKSPDSASNNRAVNIAKIKSILEHHITSNISKSTGYWKFEFDPAGLYIDYYEFLRIIRSRGELSRKDIEKLLAMVENKPFLINTNEDWLDPFKSEVSNEILDTFLSYIHRSNDDPEFLLHLTNCLFIVDPVSEEALKLKCRLLIKQGKHSLAKKAYAEFAKEYQILYDEPYSLDFMQVIEERN